MRIGYSQNYKNKKPELRSAWAAFAAQWPFELWITATFVDPISRYTAENRLSESVSRIEEQEGIKIGYYAVFNEVNAHHIHVLLLGEGENGKTLKSISVEKWQRDWKHRWGDDVLIRPIFDLPNLGAYLAKNLITHDPDLSDFWSYNLKPPGVAQHEPTSTGTTMSKGEKMLTANQSQEDFNSEELEKLIKEQAGIRDEELDDLLWSPKFDGLTAEQCGSDESKVNVSVRIHDEEEPAEDLESIFEKLLNEPVQDVTGTPFDHSLAAKIAGLSPEQAGLQESEPTVANTKDDAKFKRMLDTVSSAKSGSEESESKSESSMGTADDGRIEKRQGSSEQSESGRSFSVPIDSLQLHPAQPRKFYDDDSLKKLADTMLENGILEPLGVKKGEGGELLVVYGSRRLKAARIAGLKEVPIVLTDLDPLEAALIENMQREDILAIELAEALRDFKKKYRYTDSQVGKKVGKGRSTITEILSMNNLPDSIKDQCRRTDISRRELIKIASDKFTLDEKLERFEKLLVIAKRQELEKKTGMHFGDRRRPKELIAKQRAKDLIKVLGKLNVSNIEENQRGELFSQLSKANDVICKTMESLKKDRDAID